MVLGEVEETTLEAGIKLIQSSDRLIQQFQSNVQDSLDPLTNNNLLKGVFVSNVVLRTGITNIVPTNLNRNVLGYIVTRSNAGSLIWDTQELNKTPSQNLQLICSADVTVTLYIF